MVEASQGWAGPLGTLMVLLVRFFRPCPLPQKWLSLDYSRHSLPCL